MCPLTNRCLRPPTYRQSLLSYPPRGDGGGDLSLPFGGPPVAGIDHPTPGDRVGNHYLIHRYRPGCGTGGDGSRNRPDRRENRVASLYRRRCCRAVGRSPELGACSVCRCYRRSLYSLYHVRGSPGATRPTRRSRGRKSFDDRYRRRRAVTHSHPATSGNAHRATDHAGTKEESGSATVAAEHAAADCWSRLLPDDCPRCEEA